MTSEYISLSLSPQPSEHARAFLRSDKLSLTDTNFCPKEVLKFSPIPTSKYCKRSNFENFTSITQYDMDLKFDNVSVQTKEGFLDGLN